MIPNIENRFLGKAMRGKILSAMINLTRAFGLRRGHRLIGGVHGGQFGGRFRKVPEAAAGVTSRSGVSDAHDGRARPSKSTTKSLGEGCAGAGGAGAASWVLR